MFPSVKTIETGLKVTHEKALQIRAIMECSPAPSRYGGSTGLRKIDEVLGTFGVEYIPHGHGMKSPAIEYCNTGDPYNATVMHIRDRYVIGCWGDWVERGNYD